MVIMHIALLRISDGLIVARDEFTREELHQAIDGQIQLFRVDVSGEIEFYDPDDGCWTVLEMVETVHTKQMSLPE